MVIVGALFSTPSLSTFLLEKTKPGNEVNMIFINTNKYNMKKLILISFAALMISLSFGQTNFNWEKTDSVAKTQLQIYSDTKMFIAKTWKSAKDVIQNDDKEAGVILIKGAAIMKESFMMQEYVYVYNYNLTFKMKENKYKIILDNVVCSRAYMEKGGASATSIDPFEGDNCPETGTFKAPGLPKKKAIAMMPLLTQELQSIVDSYEKYIKTPGTASGDW